MNIQEALMLIEEYVEALQPHQWADEFDRAARSLFDWMLDYGCKPKQIEEAAIIIERYTGYRPEQISSLGEAQVVKEALYSALNTEVLGRRKRPQRLRDRLKWVLKTVEFGFGDDKNDPIDSYPDRD